jgi:CheY-like chemotaxis protein
MFDPLETIRKEAENKRVDVSLLPAIVKSAMPADVASAFELSRPATQKTEVETRPQLTQEKLRGHGERLLFVDDEDSMVFLMGRWLSRLGYRVTGCMMPERALEAFRAAPHDFDLVLSDLSMPEMSGIELARELLRIRPGMPILIASGYVAPADNDEVRSLGLPDLLPKPSGIEELAETIHNAFATFKSSSSGIQTRTESTPARVAAASGR